MSADIKEATSEIVETFGDQGVEVPRSEVREQLANFRSYNVPLDEARRSVKDSLADEHDVVLGRSDTELRDVQSIDSGDEWLHVKVQVAELWDPSSESIAQVGLVGDESGTIKFVAWEASDLPELEEGASYLLENVVTEEYEGNYSIKLNSSTEISEVDEDIEVGSNEVEFSGALVDIQSRSGLIKRCPDEDCTRVLQNGRCKEHGEVDGEFDLRIKGVLDDGTGTQKVIFGEEKTEDLVGIGLDEAQQIAMDELDMQAVIDQIRPQVMGRYLSVSGPEMGRYIVVQDFERTDAQPDYSDILSNARSMSHE